VIGKMNGYPRLYIGREYIRALKSKVTFPINHVRKEELSDFISYYSSFTTLKNPLVIEDISDYRGEIKVPLLNLSDENIEFKLGQRVAQCLLVQVKQANLVQVEHLSDTIRGIGCFGSTGL
jgi:hypothetical protein